MNFSFQDFFEYGNSIQPKTILHLFPKNSFQFLMQYFSLDQQAGMALLYDDLETQGELYRVDTFDNDEPKRLKLFNPFCGHYRTIPAQNARCEKCDKDRAWSVLNEGLTGLNPYPCHMGLTDISYGLHVGGQVRAVLFAGQLIVEGTEDKIHKRIATRAVQGQHSQLQEIVKNTKVDVQTVSVRTEFFNNVATRIQLDINRLYSDRRTIALQQLVNKVSEFLAPPAPDSAQAAWWKIVEVVLNGLKPAIGCNSITVLSRRNARYHVTALTSSGRGNENVIIPVKELINVAIDNVVQIGGQASLLNDLKNRLGSDFSGGYIYRLDNLNDTEMVRSIVIIMEGAIDETMHEMVCACCRVIANRAFVEGLTETLRSSREDFKTRVAFTAHTIKTPLQNTWFVLDRLKNLPVADERVRRDRDNLVAQATQFIQSVRYEADGLQRETTNSLERFDIRGMISSLLKDFEYRATSEGVTFKHDSDGKEFNMIADRSQIRIALNSLIDNAIKYSYHNKSVIISYKPSSSTIEISISNYGIGFSEELHQHIFDPGVRAEVPDDKKERYGYGLGLPQAKRIIEKFGGLLDVSSQPADTGAREKDQRYKTTATIIFHLR